MEQGQTFFETQAVHCKSECFLFRMHYLGKLYRVHKEDIVDNINNKID